MRLQRRMISLMDCLRNRELIANVYKLDQYLGEFDLRPFTLIKNCQNTEKIAKTAYDFVGESPNMLFIALKVRTLK